MTSRQPEPEERTPRQELLRVLDEEHAAAVIEHRQRIRKPLTAYAARLLAKEFAKCRDPNAAADYMILHGWQGFEAAWMDKRKPQVNGTRHAPAFFDAPQPTPKRTPEEIAKAREMQRRVKEQLALATANVMGRG